MVGCSLNPARGRHGGVREELTAGIKKSPGRAGAAGSLDKGETLEGPESL